MVNVGREHLQKCRCDGGIFGGQTAWQTVDVQPQRQSGRGRFEELCRQLPGDELDLERVNANPIMHSLAACLQADAADHCWTFLMCHRQAPDEVFLHCQSISRPCTGSQAGQAVILESCDSSSTQKMPRVLEHTSIASLLNTGVTW